MKPQVDPKVDYAFKHVFGREANQPLLISLVDSVLQPSPEHAIASVDILNPFNEKDALDDKLSILDIKARDQSGRQFNLEMQLLAYGAFRQRALYYWAKLHQAQLQQGMDYQILRPTIAICFVDTVLFPKLAEHHLVFELREQHHGVVFTDHLQVHILELRKFTKSATELVTVLDRWLYFLKNGQDLDVDALPAALDMPEIRRALGDLLMMTQSDLERERYESRLKMQRDVYSALVEARDTGWQEGQLTRIHGLQKLLRQGPTPSEELRGLSSAELDRLTEQLEAEVSRRLNGK